MTEDTRLRSDPHIGRKSVNSLTSSDKARELQRALLAVQGSPDAREEIVAALRRRIAEGTYAVPAEALALKILLDHPAHTHRSSILSP